MKSLPALTSFRNRAMISFYVEWYVKSTWLNGITLPVIVINEIDEVKQDTTALILLSIAEGSPNVGRKAMACNVPIVATNVGDVAQVIGHTEGCRACPHDPHALAAGLEIALLHSEPKTGRVDTSHLSSSAIVKQCMSQLQAKG